MYDGIMEKIVVFYGNIKVPYTEYKTAEIDANIKLLYQGL
jgi:hypothetical protein